MCLSNYHALQYLCHHDSLREYLFSESYNMNLASATVIMSTQSRYRNVLTWPTPKSGTPCPSLIERNPCPLLGASCKRHKWKPKVWSKCILPPDAGCGDGIRVRGKSTSIPNYLTEYQCNTNIVNKRDITTNSKIKIILEIYHATIGEQRKFLFLLLC